MLLAFTYIPITSKTSSKPISFTYLMCCLFVHLFSHFILNQYLYGTLFGSLRVKKDTCQITLFDVSNMLVDQSGPEYDCTSHNNLTRSFIFYVVITHYSACHKKKLASSWIQTMLFPKNIAKQQPISVAIVS